MLKVIGKNGDHYLIDLGEGRGQVLDLERNILTKPQNLLSIIQKGYWEGYEMPKKELATKIAGVENQDSEWVKDAIAQLSSAKRSYRFDRYKKTR